MEQPKQVSITDQVGSLLPQLHSMACFTQFCACKVKNLDEEKKDLFNHVSNSLATIFKEVSRIYVDMSEDERCAISPFDDPYNREEVSKND